MCNCKDIEIGSYANQTEIAELPPHIAAYKAKHGGASSICLDTCIAHEVQYLWALGITTTGCCCGHNKVNGYIGVVEQDIERMKLLGYEVRTNEHYPEAQDSFSPKSLVN